MKNNPCNGSLTTTVVAADGTSHVTHPEAAADPPIDCFYVYPTVSEQKTVNATMTVDAQVSGVTIQQAARFSTVCRVFAPVYPQLTLTAITGTGKLPAAASAKAFQGVQDAWTSYLSHYNDGRGVVLIGHSQGAGMLTQLIHRDIDNSPAMRTKLVSAILVGGNIIVPRGKDVGGSFAKVPACRKAGQLHCVIAYSSFGEAPPADASFGRAGSAFSSVDGGAKATDPEVLCTNPAALAGGKAPLISAFATDILPGVLGTLTKGMFNGTPPTAPTPWIQADGQYNGECVDADGADVLRITPVGNAPTISAAPTAAWGLHIVDVNLTLGNLIDDVKAESAAYTR